MIDWYFSILELVGCVLVCCRQSLKQLKMPCVFPAPLFNKHEALASCLSLLGFFPHVCKVAIILVICLIWLRRLMRQRVHVFCKLLGTPPNCTNSNAPVLKLLFSNAFQDALHRRWEMRKIWPCALNNWILLRVSGNDWEPACVKMADTEKMSLLC